MNKPKLLSKGDTVAIVSTARKISEVEIEPAIDKLQQWGLNVKLGENIFETFNQFAGTDQQRASDFQSMIDDENVKAIICARGGYGSVKIIDLLDFTKFKQKPKWIVGYSDVTVLHSHINAQFAIPTIHATMPINFPAGGDENSSLTTLHDCLFDGRVEHSFRGDSHRCEKAFEGEIVGGNLSILYSLMGSKSDISTKDKILFIEDLDEYLYHIDRMMMNLKRTGKLGEAKALVVGGMTEMRDNTVPYGKNAREIITEICQELGLPVLFNFPAGHISDNRAIILGEHASLEIVAGTTFFKQKYTF